MENHHPANCVKCDAELQPPDSRGGRPSRFCSEGCKVSTEAKMRRINLVLKRLELDKAWQQRHSRHQETIERIDETIAEWQREYDHLAGVPERAS